jgi:hypothetical protein
LLGAGVTVVLAANRTSLFAIERAQERLEAELLLEELLAEARLKPTSEPFAEGKRAGMQWTTRTSAAKPLLAAEFASVAERIVEVEVEIRWEGRLREHRLSRKEWVLAP